MISETALRKLGDYLNFPNPALVLPHLRDKYFFSFEKSPGAIEIGGKISDGTSVYRIEIERCKPMQVHGNLTGITVTHDGKVYSWRALDFPLSPISESFEISPEEAKKYAAVAGKIMELSLERSLESRFEIAQQLGIISSLKGRFVA